MDPLTYVRDYNKEGKAEHITINGDKVQFGSTWEFPKASRTGFKPSQGPAQPCNLETVLYVLRTRHFNHPDYMKQTVAANMPTLSFPDRLKLLDILDGKAAYDVSDAFLAEDEQLEPAAKRSRQDDEHLKFQRELRDRNSMLLATNSKDFKRVLDISDRSHVQISAHLKEQQKQQLKAERQAAARPPPDKAPSQPRPPPPPPAPTAAAHKGSGRYNRDTTADALKAMGGDANLLSAIDMYGTGGSMQTASQPASGASQPQPANGSTARPSSYGHPPSSSKPHESQPRPHSSSHSQKPHHTSSQPKPHPSSKPSSSRPSPDRVPIILVPSGMTAMINMYNARQFLAEGKYESATQLQAAGAPKLPEVKYERTAGKPAGRAVTYIVTDKAPAKEDTAKWDRVVAVIVSGQKWQFRDWPFTEGNMVEIFSKIAGFYIHFSDEKVHEGVANWNVKRLGLAREKRHMDHPVMLEFYRHLDSFLTSKKSPLNF